MVRALNMADIEIWRARFLKSYASVPQKLRDDVIAIIDERTYSWNSAYVEVLAKSPLGDRILQSLADVGMFKQGGTMDEDYVKELVAARLRTIPPNVGFSLGSYGNFTRDEIISHVLRGTEVVNHFSDMEVKMLIESPMLVGRLSGGKKASSD